MKTMYLIGFFLMTLTNTVAQSFTTILPTEAIKLLQKKNVVLLDVRTAQEFAEGHLKNAVNHDLYSMDEKNTNALLPDKNAVILVYCRSGNRSKQASSKLAQWNYKTIYEIGAYNALLSGGFEKDK